MTHLTLTGYYAGRPLCDCHKPAAKAQGDEFVHAAYADLDRITDLCPACALEWRRGEDSDDV